jgi:hypothetical protein
MFTWADVSAKITQGQLAMKKASKTNQRLPVEMVIACITEEWRR